MRLGVRLDLVLADSDADTAQRAPVEGEEDARRQPREGSPHEHAHGLIPLEAEWVRIETPLAEGGIPQRPVVEVSEQDASLEVSLNRPFEGFACFQNTGAC